MTTTEYFYNGDILAGQKTGNKVMLFLYDETGDYFGFTYGEHEYYYVKNAQNDVTAIANADGTVIANYDYDPWGQITEITGNTTIAEHNPIRYRSYYYDAETQWYFLTTRYYSPAMHRFLNADGVLAANQDINAYNLFAYCSNDPVNYMDETGQGRTIVHCYGNRYCPICGFPSIERSSSTSSSSTRPTTTIPVSPHRSNGGSFAATPFIYNVYNEISKSAVSVTADAAFEMMLVSVPDPPSSLLHSTRSVMTGALKGVSRSVGVASGIVLAADLYWDYTRYGQNPSDFAKAATVTALATVVTVAVGFLMPATAVGVIGAIVIGAAIGTVTPYIKEWWVGY